MEGPRKRLSIHTRRHRIDAISVVMKRAVKLGYIHESPVREFKQQLPPEKAEPQIEPIRDARQIQRLLVEARAEGELPGLLVLTLLETGMRLGEALGLTWGAIAWGSGPEDLERYLKLRDARSRGAKERGPLKTKKSNRDIRLSKRLWHALRARYESQFKPGSDVLVFASRIDSPATDGSLEPKWQPLDPYGFRRRPWKRICHRAGGGHMQLKQFRDTYITWLLHWGVRPMHVKGQAGHANLATTSQYYTGELKETSYQQIEAIDDDHEWPADLFARKFPIKERPHPRDRQ